MTTKKQMQMQALDEMPTMVDTVTPVLETIRELNAAYELRETSVELALQHHKINGGMLTPNQLIEIAKYFHAYITGEVK